MPVLDGLELYNRMREIDKSVQVMLLTASHAQLQIDNNQESEEHLRFNIVRKPVTISRLLLEINSIINIKEKSAYVHQFTN